MPGAAGLCALLEAPKKTTRFNAIQMLGDKVHRSQRQQVGTVATPMVPHAENIWETSLVHFVLKDFGTFCTRKGSHCKLVAATPDWTMV
jgi:hypothetical protein